jgi:hypothetical protein
LSVHDEQDETLESRSPDHEGADGEKDDRRRLDSNFFNLSGGILREERRDSKGAIDDLLLKLMAHPTGRRIKSVDRNLDYLHTCLQLDMIRMIAEGIEQPQQEKDEEDVARDRVVRTLRGSVEYISPP